MPKFDIRLKGGNGTGFAPQVELIVSIATVTEDGLVVVSEDLATDAEIDACIKGLKQNLDSVATKAKAAIRK